MCISASGIEKLTQSDDKIEFVMFFVSRSGSSLIRSFSFTTETVIAQ